jgi:hypothetical protein
MRSITYKPPQEVVAGAAPDPLRRVAAAILIATLVTMLLGSKAFLAWSNDLPISQASDFLLYIAQGWQDAMEAIGLTLFADAIHQLLHWLQGVR